MLNLAYVSMKVAPFDEGGPATVAYHLLKNFAKTHRIRVTLIVGNSATEKEIIDTLGNGIENVVRIPLKRSIYTYTYENLLKMREVWRALDYVDIVHFNLLQPLRNFYLPLFTSLRRKPSVRVLHSIGGPELQGFFYGEKARFLKDLAFKTVVTSLYLRRGRLYSKIVVNSQFVKTAISKKVDQKRICLIPNGIDCEEIAKSPRIDLEGNPKLLFVGKLKPVKGLDLLLKALSSLSASRKKDMRLYIAGSGEYEKKYKSLATKLNVNRYVEFLGRLPLRECYSLYKSCDLLIMPSRLEGYPMALLEALGSGIPIIATSVGGIPEIVKNNRNGLIVTLNPAEIAEKIGFLIDHPELREQISRNNLTDAKKHSWEKITQKFLDLYNSLI